MKAVADWLFPQVWKQVLALLLGHPDRRWHLRELSRRTGFALGTLRRELKGLTDAGIALRTRDGNRTCYEPNRQCPVYGELAGLMRKTAGLADVLRDALVRLSARIEVAFVYGSMANGTQGSASDIDLMVIGDVSFGEIVAVLGPAQDALGREVNPTVYPPSEFGGKLARREHFPSAVMKGAKLFVIGGERELEGLAGERLAD